MRKNPVPFKIVSGGQTGVDRAALDLALRHGIDCGGWCPEGRKAEDGPIGDRYPLQELPGGDYRDRTERNVLDTDATIIIYFDRLRGGTEATLQFCLDHAKPHLLLDGAEIEPAQAADRIRGFIATLSGTTLNFAGPRASKEPRAYPYCAAALERLLATGDS